MDNLAWWEKWQPQVWLFMFPLIFGSSWKPYEKQLYKLISAVVVQELCLNWDSGAA